MGGQGANDAIDELPGKLNQRDIRVLGKRGTSFAGGDSPSGGLATSRSSMG